MYGAQTTDAGLRNPRLFNRNKGYVNKIGVECSGLVVTGLGAYEWEAILALRQQSTAVFVRPDPSGPHTWKDWIGTLSVSFSTKKPQTHYAIFPLSINGLKISKKVE